MRAGPHRPARLGLDPDVVWGVYAGGCVKRDGLFDDAHVIAHAHVGPGDPWRGWICTLSRDDVLTETGRPTMTLLHEAAHLMVGSMRHDAEWRAALRSIGGGAEASRYRRR